MKGWTKKKQKEESIQIQISEYVKLAYPHVKFTAESAGIRLTMGQAIKAKRMRSERGLPDFIMMEPKGKYHGLMIELKREDDSPFKKDGTLKKKTITRKDGTTYDHNEEQINVLKDLNAKGYYASYGIGFEQAKMIVDNYMNQ